MCQAAMRCWGTQQWTKPIRTQSSRNPRTQQRISQKVNRWEDFMLVCELSWLSKVLGVGRGIERLPENKAKR